MTKIAIIGGGIVGSTAAYYLARQGIEVTLFDDGTGQATKAAAGIICPWFSQRRNKPWYHLVSKGAEFYRQFMLDLAIDGFDTSSIFQEQGALLIRNSETALARDIEAAKAKRQESPSIQQVTTISPENLKDYFPLIETTLSATHVEGAAKVDGEILIRVLHEAINQFGGNILNEQAKLTENNYISSISMTTTHFDKILLATGAWLPFILNPLNYSVDIHPQKGQLLSIYHEDWKNNHWPVVIPPGKVDIIPNANGEIVLGATHEDDKGYDLTPDHLELNHIVDEASKWIPNIREYPVQSIRVGTRAHTSDYSILIGEIPDLPNVWAISGLGSSGLTSGPYLGYQWSQLISTGNWEIIEKDYPIHQYISKIIQ